MTKRYISKLQARMERSARAREEGFVYFIACGPYIKIGHSQDHPRERMRAMATYNPFPIELVGMLVAGRDREREIQQRFAGSHHVLEWFHAAPELLAYVAEICGDWHALDREKRITMSVEERIARDMGLGVADLWWPK